MLSLGFLKAATPTFTAEQFQYLLTQAAQPTLNSDAFNGKTKTAKMLGIEPFLERTVFGEVNPIKKRYSIVQKLLSRAPADANYSCLETQTCPLEATMAFMIHLNTQELRPRLDKVLARRFPEGALGNPSGMFIADIQGALTAETTKHNMDFYEWCRDNRQYHLLFEVDPHLALRSAETLSNAAGYLLFLGEQKKLQANYAQSALPILFLAQKICPNLLVTYFTLSRCYIVIQDPKNRDFWYDCGNKLSMSKHQKSLKEYVLGSPDVTVSKIQSRSLKSNDPKEMLIVARGLPGRKVITDKERLILFEKIIEDSSDEKDRAKAFNGANELLTPSLLKEILEEKVDLLTILCSNESFPHDKELRRKITQAIISLEDLILAITWAKKLGLREALDTVTEKYSKSQGLEGAKVFIFDSAETKKNPENASKVFAESMKHPANALSLDALDMENLRDLSANLRQLGESGLKQGDSAYDKTVEAIKVLKAESDRKQKAILNAGIQESNRFWGELPPAATAHSIVGKVHRSGPASCAAAAAETKTSESRNNNDNDAIDLGAIRNEAERGTQVPLTKAEQARFDCLTIQFEEAEGSRIKAILQEKAQELHSFTFHVKHGETASNLSADRIAEYKRLCFERYKLMTED